MYLVVMQDRRIVMRVIIEEYGGSIILALIGMGIIWNFSAVLELI